MGIIHRYTYYRDGACRTQAWSAVTFPVSHSFFVLLRMCVSFTVCLSPSIYMIAYVWKVFRNSWTFHNLCWKCWSIRFIIHGWWLVLVGFVLVFYMYVCICMCVGPATLTFESTVCNNILTNAGCPPFLTFRNPIITLLEVLQVHETWGDFSAIWCIG